jgi:hypothetical protein
LSLPRCGSHVNKKKIVFHDDKKNGSENNNAPIIAQFKNGGIVKPGLSESIYEEREIPDIKAETT